MGYRNTLDGCTDHMGLDEDSDVLEEDCENTIAEYFAPMLSTNPGDYDLSRESYWAAIPIFDAYGDASQVRVIYLLGYHNDNGNHHDCTDLFFSYCNGHPGDSEFIWLDISYNPTTRHWLLDAMFTSAHWGEQLPWGGSIDFSRNTPWNEAEYPSGASRSYPRTYVALNKHANYHTRAACDGGGYHNSDDCTTNYDTGRFTIPAGFTWEQRNVGSSEVPRIDRQTSIAGYPGVEWFWDSALNFCGWSNTSSAPADRQGCASPYQNILSFYGF